ncbi:MAG: hypothetical protein MUE51_03680 [Thermoleophilia bacterium]|nr:hypothetical protein [Thermoleophilia bacterium]
MGLFRRRRHPGGDDALEPIAGVSLERYADLCARMAGVGDDEAAFRRIAAEQGVEAADWDAARAGWNARMHDPGTAGAVALAYMPLYQAALARHGGPPATATLDEYVEMSALISTDVGRPASFEAMYAAFGIDAPRWSQISTHWVDRLRTDPRLGAEYGERVRARVRQLDAEWRRGRPD